MRIALCYYGNTGWYQIPGSKKMPLSPSVCFKSVIRHIKQKNQVIDIFVHSWSKEAEKEILSIFSPKIAKFEAQKDFFPSLQDHFRLKSLADLKLTISAWLRLKNCPNYESEALEVLKRSYSRWYSTKQVLLLKQSYEREKKFKYDFVMFNRFDIDWYTDIDFSLFDSEYFYSADPSDLDRQRHNFLISEDSINYYPKKRILYDKPLIHQIRERLNISKTPFWVQPNWKNAILIKLGLNHYNLSDTWFFGGNDVMDRFGLLYDCITNYHPSPHVAAYEHICGIVGKRKLRFPFEQFVDFDLYRHSKACGVQYPKIYLRK